MSVCRCGWWRECGTGKSVSILDSPVCLVTLCFLLQERRLRAGDPGRACMARHSPRHARRLLEMRREKVAQAYAARTFIMNGQHVCQRPS